MSLREKIDQLLLELSDINAKHAHDAEELRIRFLGKKGSVTQLFEEFKAALPEQKRELGQLLNNLKNRATEKIHALKEELREKEQQRPTEDMTLPGDAFVVGARHPVSITRSEIIRIFSRSGYHVAEGPEVEDDWHVFGALNFPPDHPARDMQDTFFITSGENPVLLRTHTSSVQVRAMKRMKPPIRIICPGRVFRNEAISARAHCIFHQVEGLYVAENVSFADLKQTLQFFTKEMFGEKSQIRLRPSFFPFTEPSAEMDVSCTCGGKGCNLCKGTGWLEIMGCGMVHPNVLDNCGIDSRKYSGFAFGMGIERPAFLKFHIKDIRMYFENDVRFLKQFAAII